MRKELAFVVAAVVIVVLGSVVWFSSRPAAVPPAGDAMMPKEESMMPKTDEMMMPKADDAMMKKDDDAMMPKDESAAMKDDTMKKDDGTMMPSPAAGSYEPYAPEKLARVANGDVVVLFFRASWCPTCRALDADIRAHASGIPAGVTVLDVNYDDSTALRQKYGVTYQHTLVQVDAAGGLIAKWAGSPTLAALVAQVR